MKAFKQYLKSRNFVEDVAPPSGQMPADGQKPESQPDDPHAKLAHVLELLQQALQAVQEIVGPADGQQQGGEQPQPGQQQPGGQQVTQ